MVKTYKFQYDVTLEITSDARPYSPKDYKGPRLRIIIGAFDRVHKAIKGNPWDSCTTLELDVVPFEEAKLNVVHYKDTKRRIYHDPIKAQTTPFGVALVDTEVSDAYPLILGPTEQLIDSVLDEIATNGNPAETYLKENVVDGDLDVYRYDLSRLTQDVIVDKLREAIERSGLDQEASHFVLEAGKSIRTQFNPGLGLEENKAFNIAEVTQPLVVIRKDYPEISSTHLSVARVVDMQKEKNPDTNFFLSHALRDAELTNEDIAQCAKILGIETRTQHQEANGNAKRKNRMFSRRSNLSIGK